MHIMIQEILQTIYTKYQSSDTNGIFLSGYDHAGKLLISQGVLESDQTIDKTTTDLYDTYIKPLNHIDLVVIDIVKNLVEQQEYTVVLNMDPHDFGLMIKMVGTEQIGMILPNTAEIVDMAHAIYAIKQKYTLSGDVILYSFQTDRLVYVKPSDT